MVEYSLIIQCSTGIHARPAALITKEASRYKSAITLIKAGRQYNAKSIMNVMSMAANQGEEILVRAVGEDEAAALEAIVSLIKNGLE